MKRTPSWLPVVRGLLLASLVVSSVSACRGEPDGAKDAATDGPHTSPHANPDGRDADVDQGAADEADASDSCPTPTQAGSGDNHAGLVVTFGDGTTEAICVAFSEGQINGYDLLQASGLTIVSEYSQSQDGYAICKISNGGSDGCDYPDETCFCNADGKFWAFWILENDSTWVSSQVGVSQATVTDGDVQGQKWQSGQDPPPVCTFEQICGGSAASPPTGN